MHIVEWLSKVMTFEGDSAPLAKFVSDSEKAEDAPRPVAPLSADLDQPCSTLTEFRKQTQGRIPSSHLRKFFVSHNALNSRSKSDIIGSVPYFG